MGRLTVRQIKAFDRAGLYGDGDGLYLSVARVKVAGVPKGAPGRTAARDGDRVGAKSWIQRITINGRRCDIGLGPWPLVSIAEARDAAFENRRTIRNGGNPLKDRARKPDVPTFREAADKVLAMNRERWRGSKTEANWTGQFERYVFPVIGDARLDRIRRKDVLDILSPIWAPKPETARKVRMRIRQVFQWAEAHGHVAENVAGDAIAGALPAMPAKGKNHRALPYAETRAALATVAASAATAAVRLAFRFTVLTACRSGEARGAVWAEIDVERREWRIPGERMKNGKEHRIPLSDAALAVLAESRDLADGSDLVFPSPNRRGKPLSDMALTRLLRANGLADRATVHGFRSSFRDWASECTQSPHAVMELCLAHDVGSAVERAYARSDLLEKRRSLMAEWAEFLTEGI
ncbi:MAG: tyrosine-type recombinase/integrase [Rhodospirillaceae bacterium]|nr:tyrosine-type recombinase/integrase [Rhodospirillaceae bacterium]